MLLTFNNGDAGAGKDQEVLLVVKLAMILRTALTGPKYNERVADLLEPATVALKRTVRAHRLASNPLQITDIRDERAIHPTEHTSAQACTATRSPALAGLGLSGRRQALEERLVAWILCAPGIADLWSVHARTLARNATLYRLSQAMPSFYPGRGCANCVLVHTVAIAVLIALLAVPLLIVGVMFVWAAIRDGEDDRAVQGRLGRRRNTHLGW
jgi:hypothetical protein